MIWQEGFLVLSPGYVSVLLTWGIFGGLGFDFAAGILWDSAVFDAFVDFGEGVVVLVAGVLLTTADLRDFTISLRKFALGLAMIARPHRWDEASTSAKQTIEIA